MNSVKLEIFTTFGQFVQFGNPKIDINFSWEYYYNLQYFDGFKIGWNDNSINYLASLVIENTGDIDEKKVELSDTTYDSRLYVIGKLFSDKERSCIFICQIWQLQLVHYRRR